MVSRRLHLAVVLLASLLAISGSAAQMGPPVAAPTGDSPFGPPCCDPPEIIGALSTRPPGETRAQLAAWLGQRFRSQGAEAADLDIQALTGACEGDCPTPFRAALETLRELRGLDVDLDDHGAPCCTGPVAATGRGGRPAAPRGASEQTRAMSAQVDTLYTDSIIRRIAESPGDVALWLPDYLRGIRLRRVRLLSYRLAGRCPGQACTPALATGLVIARERLQGSEQEAQRLIESQARQADAAAQESERQTAILLTVIASIITLVGVLITLLWTGWQSRKHARSLEAWLAKLDNRLSALSTVKPKRRSPRAARGRGSGQSGGARSQTKT